MRSKPKNICGTSSQKLRQDRNNKKVIAAHFDIEAYNVFKLMASDQTKNIDLLLHEAIAELFKKYKKPIPKSILHKLKIRGIDI